MDQICLQCEQINEADFNDGDDLARMPKLDALFAKSASKRLDRTIPTGESRHADPWRDGNL